MAGVVNVFRVGLQNLLGTRWQNILCSGVANIFWRWKKQSGGRLHLFSVVDMANIFLWSGAQTFSYGGVGKLFAPSQNMFSVLALTVPPLSLQFDHEWLI